MRTPAWLSVTASNVAPLPVSTGISSGCYDCKKDSTPWEKRFVYERLVRQFPPSALSLKGRRGTSLFFFSQ
eukprot:g40939.t1